MSWESNFINLAPEVLYSSRRGLPDANTVILKLLWNILSIRINRVYFQLNISRKGNVIFKITYSFTNGTAHHPYKMQIVRK